MASALAPYTGAKIKVPSLEAAEQFYSGRLGLWPIQGRSGRYFAGRDGSRCLILALGHWHLVLEEQSDSFVGEHTNIILSATVQFARELRNAGVDVSEFTRTGYGAEATLVDPFGNLLILYNGGG